MHISMQSLPGLSRYISVEHTPLLHLRLRSFLLLSHMRLRVQAFQASLLTCVLICRLQAFLDHHFDDRGF